MVTVYLNLANGYVDGYGSTLSNDSDIKVKLDKEHDFFKTNMHAWKFADGELIFDEEKQQKLIEEEEKANTKPSAENMNALAILELAEKFEKLKEEK